MQDKKKKTKKQIKVQDLKPSKDAKGGVVASGPGHQVSGPGHGVTGPGHGVTRPGNQNT
jgi:hypothetical protein